MAKKRKKKPPHDAIEPKGNMLPAEGAAAPKDDEGTRIDDAGRHVFFSFKGELKSDLPDATETDLAGNLGLPQPADDETESEPEVEAADETQQESAEAAGASPDATATEHDHAPDAAADLSADSSAVAPSGAKAETPPGAEADETPVDRAEQPPSAGMSAEAPPDLSAAAPGAEADETSADAGDDAATHTELHSVAPPRKDREQDQSRAGPVRGPVPAAEEKSASQSRKAAGPAHFIPPQEPSLGDSAAAKPKGPAGKAPVAPPAAAKPATQAKPGAPAKAAEPPKGQAEPTTHTDVRGEPFVPALGDVTHTEIDPGLFAPRPADEVPADAATETEVRPPRDAAPPAPPPIAKPRTPAKAHDHTVGSETVLDALARSPRRDEARPDDATAGSATVLDTQGVRGPEPEATGTQPDAVTRTEPDGARPFADPDAETRTKDPFATATGARETADLAEPTTKSSADATTDPLEGPPALWPAPADFPAAPEEDSPAATSAEAEAPSFHDAETASQDLEPIAREAALPPQGVFDLPADETQLITASRPDVPTVEAPSLGAPPTPFTGALFEAPEPTTSEEPAPERAERPRIRSRRRGARTPQEPVLKRLTRWAKRHLDPRDFLEIVGTAVFERAKKLGEKVRTERRENRVSHSAEWWRKTLVELGILYAIVIPIELAVTGGRLGSFGVHPHPYWLVVLPMAAARGLVAGLLAAGVASVLYAIGAAQAVTDAVFTFRNMTEPLLFFAVAFFAGELHDEGLLKRRKGERRIKDLEERTEQLRQQRDVLTDANRELEKRIVDDSVQFGNLIQAARRIERAGRQEVFDLALEMAEEHCGAAASVLMLLEDGTLDYLCHRGFPSDEIGKRLAIARQSAFVKRAVSEGVAVNGLDPSEVAPQEGPLVVAPLFDAGGVVKALMCLDEIPLARLNESTVTVFLGIADWASAALARLTRGADAPAPRAAGFSVGPEVDLWLGTVAELGKRLRVELARSSRYGVPTSFLTVQATDWKDATREGIDALDRFILMHFTTGLRPSDGIYRFGYPGAYLLVLAGTSLKGAEVVRTRLERRVAYTPSPFGAVEIVATGPDTEAPDLMSLIARCARNFRERSRLPLEARCPVTVPERLEAEDLNAFLRRLKMETSLAVRNGIDLHVVGISAEASEHAGPGILARHVVEVGEQTLRPTDGVYMIGQYQCAVILPCTNGEEAATVAHRLATLVRARDPSAPYGQIETQVLGLGPSHPDAGSFLTALARRGRETSR